MSDRGARWPLRRVFRLPATRARVRREVDEELQFHLEGRIEELMARGFSRRAAEEEAHRRFGDQGAYHRETVRIDQRTIQERRLMDFLDDVVRETRQAARALARSRGFTMTAVLTLSVGLGAATAIFTMLDAVVLRPLPYSNADRLVALSSPVPKFEGDTLWGLARHEMFYFLEHSRTLADLGVYQHDQATVMGDGSSRPAERARVAAVSASLFRVLGFAPERGRLFTLEDNRPGNTNLVVLGHGYWQRRFGGDEAIVGRAINIEGMPMTVVGILPPEAQLPDAQVDLWMPAEVHPSMPAQNNHTWGAIGQLRPGFTAADAQRELAPLTSRLPEFFPQAEPRNFIESTGFRTQVLPLRDVVVGAVMTQALWILFAAVLVVLAIAAANLSSLFLVRHEARRRELAVRAALGAARRQLVAHSLAESLLIALAAAVLALALAQLGLHLLLAIAPTDFPRLNEVHLGAAAIAFAAAGATVVALALGLLPVVGPPALDVALLRDGGRGLTASPRRHLVRGTLVVSQVALSLVLLTAAGLMVRSFQKLRAVPPGFDARSVLTLNIALPIGKYRGGNDVMPAKYRRVSTLYEQIARRVEQLPGVAAAGFSEKIPLAGTVLCTGVTLEDGRGARGACPATALVSPGYFEAMGIHVDGRSLTWAGLDQHAGDMVVSRSFASQQWPGERAIGRGIRYHGTAPPFYRVSGVADDVLAQGFDQPPVAIVYFPMLPIPGAMLWGVPTYMNLAVRTRGGDPMQLAPAITRIVAELEPQATIGDVQTMETLVAKSMARRSFTMLLLGVAAAMALFLSVVGLYGVLSYVVGERRGEIAIRRALGAHVSQVSGMVVRQAARLAVLGIAIGLLAALTVTRVLQSLLFGVSPTDPTLLAGAAVVLLAIALAAGFLPAQRAARVDPADALRTQ